MYYSETEKLKIQHSSPFPRGKQRHLSGWGEEAATLTASVLLIFPARKSVICQTSVVIFLLCLGKKKKKILPSSAALISFYLLTLKVNLCLEGLCRFQQLMVSWASSFYSCLGWRMLSLGLFFSLPPSYFLNNHRAGTSSCWSCLVSLADALGPSSLHVYLSAMFANLLLI